jgi:hypothetical protein
MTKLRDRRGVEQDASWSTQETRSRCPHDAEPPIEAVDRPRGLADAAAALGVPYHVVQRAARRGLVPTYRLGTSRPYVKLRDFLDLMRRDTNG